MNQELNRFPFEGAFSSQHIQHCCDAPDALYICQIYLNSWLRGSLFLPSQNNLPASAMTRRNTYVCTDRSNADRHSLLQNGKENR